MLNSHPLGASTIKITCDHYQKLVNESSFLEQELSSYGTALSKTLISLALRESNFRPPGLAQVKELRESVWGMMQKSKERLQKECTVIIEVTACIRKVTHQFRQLIDVMRNEQERSCQKISQLVGQMRAKQHEIERCQSVVENERNRMAEQVWRRMHYVNAETVGVGEEPPGVTYLRVLREIRNKMDNQVNAERRQQRNFTSNVMDKLKDFKTRLMKAWHLLPLNKNEEKYTPAQEDQMKQEISELERRYLQREQEMDEFKVEDLVEIKKKLKLLEEAEMSESREYMVYSVSGERQEVVESEVVGLVST